VKKELRRLVVLSFSSEPGVSDRSQNGADFVAYYSRPAAPPSSLPRSLLISLIQRRCYY